MAVDLELYRVFSAVAEAGSFSMGAQNLFITQPAASQAVHKLEEELGTRLFTRGRRGVTLTQEGELLYRHVSSALDILNAGERSIERVQNLEEGLLKIGAADTITKELLLPYIGEFRKLHPGVQVQVTNRTSLQLTDRLCHGELDIAVVNLPIDDERLTVQPIREIHDIFVAGPEFFEMCGRPVTPEELSRQPLIMLESASNSRRYVDKFFADNGVTLRPQIELGAHDLLTGFAAIGFGLSCVVKEFCEKDLKSGVVKPVALTFPIPPRHIGACRQKGVPLSRAGDEFLKLLTKERL